MITEKTTFTEDIEGEEFLLRRWCLAVAVEVFGSKAFLMMSEAPEGVKTPELSPEEEKRIEEKFFRTVMIRPRLAGPDDVRDASTGRFPVGVYDLLDLGDARYRITRAVLAGRELNLGFLGPSQGQMESS